MKRYLVGKSIPKTEDFLDRQGWEIDRYDGVVSLKNEKESVAYTDQITIGFRKVIIKVDFDTEGPSFFFQTTKDSEFLKEKHLKNKAPETWFNELETLVTILAKELGFSKIVVCSGKKDMAFLRSKGYSKDKHYFYHKNV